MFGPFTVGKKAAKYGYKKFGVPGAVVGGLGAAVGYRAVKKRTKSAVEDAATDDGASESETSGDEMSGDETSESQTSEDGTSGDDSSDDASGLST